MPGCPQARPREGARGWRGACPVSPVQVVQGDLQALQGDNAELQGELQGLAAHNAELEEELAQGQGGDGTLSAGGHPPAPCAGGYHKPEDVTS